MLLVTTKACVGTEASVGFGAVCGAGLLGDDQDRPGWLVSSFISAGGKYIKKQVGTANAILP